MNTQHTVQRPRSELPCICSSSQKRSSRRGEMTCDSDSITAIAASPPLFPLRRDPPQQQLNYVFHYQRDKRNASAVWMTSRDCRDLMSGTGISTTPPFGANLLTKKVCLLKTTVNRARWALPLHIWTVWLPCLFTHSLTHSFVVPERTKRQTLTYMLRSRHVYKYAKVHILLSLLKT